jgi:hypothetical protein
MARACNCVSPRYPCQACGAGYQDDWNRFGQWPPTPITTTITTPTVIVNVDALHERIRTLERGLRAIRGHLNGDGSGDDEIDRIIKALDVE